MGTRTSSTRYSVILGALALVQAVGCSGGGCGGCGGPLTKPIKFPIENGMQLRVTESGFNFIEQNLRPILDQFLPNGLKFCIPGQCQSYSYDFGIFGVWEFFRYAICHNANGDSCAQATPYRNGICTNGCEIDLNLRTVDLRPQNATDTIQIYLLFDQIRTNLQMAARSDLADIRGSCTVSVSSQSFPVTADMRLLIDPATRRLTFGENLNAQIDLANLNVRASASGNMEICDPFGLELCVGICGFVDSLLSLLVNNDTIRTLLLSVLQQPISDAVNSFFDTIRCVACDGQHPCPGGTSCQNGRCMFTAGPSAGKCVPAPLGTEAEFNAGTYVQAISPGLTAIVRASAYAGGFVDVVQNGVSAGMIAGVDAEPNHCVPDAQAPSTSAVPRATALDSNFVPCNPGETQCIANPTPYKAGFAVSERILNHAFYAVYKSGLLCLDITSDLTPFLSTDNFSLFLPSLAKLTDGRNRPMLLQVRPTQPIQLTLGQGRLRRDAQGNLVLGDNGLPIIDDPLLTLRLPDLKLAFYAMVDERLVKIFDLLVDVALPAAIYFKPDGSLAPVLGDLGQAFTNVRVSPSAILKEEPDVLRSVIDIALRQALPFVASALEGAAIQIPSFQGFELVLDDRRLKTFEGGNPVHKFVGLFADLTFAPTARAMRFAVDTEARLVSLEVPPASTYARRAGGPLPAARAVLDLSGRGPDGTPRDLEYQYRLDRGPWSLFTPSRRIVVEDSLLLLQGVHQIEVRARHRDHQTALDPTPASLTFLVDSVAPTLRLRREGPKVRFDGLDSVTPPERLVYSWRVGDGPWSAFGRDREISLSDLPAGAIRLAVRVRDESGNEATATGVFAATGRPAEVPRAGCAAAGPGATSGIGLAALLLAAILLAGRRRRGLSALLTMTLLGLATACSDSTSAPPAPSRCTSDADCPPDQTCHPESGMCVPRGGCQTDEDCGPGRYCAEDLDGDGRRDCAFRRCTTDEDCKGVVTCNAGQRAYCEAGECVCGEPCNGACPEGKYCCQATNQCTDIPVACVVTCQADTQCQSFGAAGKCLSGQCGCRAGYGLKVRAQGQIDPTHCQLEGVSCACEENPPLSFGDAGRWSDAALTGGQLWVSAYNSTYGDLVVGKYDERRGAFDWIFVDGIPANGVVTGAPSGPRGGVAEPGDDVGRDTSIAAAVDGTLHIAYWDATNGDLKYVRGVPGTAGTMTFRKHVVDGAGTSGRYTSMVLDALGRPAIAYMAVEVREGNARKSKARLARAKSVSPAAAADWDLYTLHEVALPPLPCGGGCPENQVCALTGQTYACAERGTGCSPGCLANQACVAGTCRDVYQPGGVVGLPSGTGLFNSLALASDGKLWVAFYHQLRGNLMLGSLRADAVGAPVIVDGETSAGADTGDVGRFASLRIAADGKKHITYVNATTEELWHAVVDGTSAVTEVIDTGLRTEGGEPVGPNNPDPQGNPRVVEARFVGHDSSLALTAGGGARVTYQDSSAIDLLYGIFDPGTRKWRIQSLAGHETPYTGAYGFHISHIPDGQGFRIVNYKFNLKNDSSGLDVRRAP